MSDPRSSGYPRAREWNGSTEPDDTAGEAVFHVEGIEYRIRLNNFKAFLEISEMLDKAFQSGKRFAAAALRSHIVSAIDRAESDHPL